MNPIPRPRPVHEEAESVAVEVMPRIENALGAEVDIQVSTARRYPRSMAKATRDAVSMVQSSQRIAESCIYALPRGKKKIAGPSIRMAEIVACTWGNLRCQTAIIGEEAESVVARGTCWDLEKNVAIQSESRRRIVDADGNRYNVDMITMTANAAASVALRNAIFRVVPGVVIDEIYAAAKECAIGDVQSLSDRRTKALDTFAKMGVFPDRVFARLDVAGELDITLDHLELLTGIRSALKAGDTTVDEEFPEVEKPAPRIQSPPAPPAQTPEARTPENDPAPALGPDGAAEEHRVKQIAHSLGLRPQDFAGLRAGVGLGKDSGEWTARKVAELEAAIRDHAAGAAK